MSGFDYTSGNPANLTGGHSASMADIQGPFTDLKTYLNNRIAAIPTLVTNLPAGPVDGQEIYYLADATNGVVWHLRYRAASASAYKWEFVGGGWMYSSFIGASGVSGTGSGFSDITGGNGPDITVPLAGDYDCDMWATGARASAGVVNLGIGISIGGGTQPAGDAQALGSSPGSGAAGTFALGTLLAGLSASTLLRMRYQYTVISDITYASRRFRVRPRRVG